MTVGATLAGVSGVQAQVVYPPPIGLTLLSDTNGNGVVNFDDITERLVNWWSVCP